MFRIAVNVALIATLFFACKQKPHDLLMASAVPGTPAMAEGGDKLILFGDLHVHSTYSVDAFTMNLPIMSGEGTRPLAEACDFARYCSGLDFWSTTEHAESLTVDTWNKVKEEIRACNAADTADGQPQTIAFTGFEWTQLGQDAENEYGHKNVIFKDLADNKLPPRPISMGMLPIQKTPGRFDPAASAYLLALIDIGNPLPYTELAAYMKDLQDMQICPAGIDTRKLPRDCMEVAPDSASLFEKLNQGGYESIVIPHGTAWGLHVPMLTDWKSQLTATRHDPNRQRLFEVYSGHGASEQWKAWNEPAVGEDGELFCPAPTADYLACCWRAGELTETRCEDSGSAVCQAQVVEARQRYIDAGLQGFRTVPWAEPQDWQDCGQCRDCFSPAFNYRPNGTVQRALAVSRFDNDGAPERFTFGFIGSSDTHRSTPGSGVTEARSLADGAFPRNSVIGAAYTAGLVAGLDWEFERQASFWYTGGLAAVHASIKSREAIWDALRRRETYATSGPRILLWMDLLNDVTGAKRPMGSESTVAGAPKFEVRAVGAFKQKPGCPADTLGGASFETRERVCRGACYHPGDERLPITRLEIVKILPQASEDEPIDKLVQDPWRVIPCNDSGGGCKATFEDADFARDGRYALYYVRAIQAPTPAVNAGNLRCEYDAAGRCIKMNPCYGDYRTDKGDQCFSPAEERAWSSPIYITPAH